MKKHIGVVLFCLLLQTSWAQMPMMPGMGGGPTITGKITGTLIEGGTKVPVEFATIALTKTGTKKILNGTVTDSKGYFKLDKVGPGVYTVIITFLGYKDKIIDSVTTTPAKPDLSLGKITFEVVATELDEVEIKAEKQVIENKIDKVVYNAEKDVTAAGGDASDVLRKVPMLSIDNDGNVQLRGTSNIRILINNKPSGMMANSVADALRMIPADQIKSVEVITSPSAKYDAEGSGGIINIITKKKEMEGFNGTVSLGAGSRNNNANASFSLKRGRLAINTGFGGTYFIPRKGFTEFHREDFYNLNNQNYTRTLDQSGEFFGSRNGYNGNFGVEYDLNAYNSFSSNVKLNSFGYRGTNKVDVLLADPLFIDNISYSRNSFSPTQTTNIDWTTDYRRTFKKQGQEFSTSFQIINGITDNRYTLEQNSFVPIKERSFNDGGNMENTLQADYIHPVGKYFTVETGGKGIMRKISSDINYEIYDNTSGEYQTSNSRSMEYSYNQNIYAGYGILGVKFKTYEIKGGSRYEYTDNSGTLYSVGNAASGSYTNSYGNIIPSITLAKNFKNFSNIKLTYSKRLQRPGLSNLNPFINYSDPKNVTTGNPYLNPELTDLIELSYGKFSQKTSFSVSLFYRYTVGEIQNYMTVSTDGVSISKPENIGKKDVFGTSWFGQLQLTKDWVLRGSLNVMYMEIFGYNQSNTGIQYNGNINSTYTLKKGFSLEAFAMLNSQRISLQGKNPSMSMYSLGGKKEIMKKKGSIGFSLNNIFNRYIRFSTESEGASFVQTSVNAIPFRSFSVNFSYRFGKMEFKNPRQKKRGVNNDDVKQGEGSGF